ncbi:MAG: phosphohydrolase [Actinomycetota bacterium]|nr:phosphohydrolase [Actinomycetota bacterium]
MNLRQIRDLARTAHRGQSDKSGQDYFTAYLEPIAESLEPHGEHAVMAGYLHDIIEDTDYTADRLLDLGVPAEVVGAVESVTRHTDETYPELIARATAHPLGRIVKLADNALNLARNPELEAIDPEMAARMRTRYEGARATLLSGQHTEAGQLAPRGQRPCAGLPPR